jgi:hypothetical protein
VTIIQATRRNAMIQRDIRHAVNLCRLVERHGATHWLLWGSVDASNCTD